MFQVGIFQVSRRCRLTAALVHAWLSSRTVVPMWDSPTACHLVVDIVSLGVDVFDVGTVTECVGYLVADFVVMNGHGSVDDCTAYGVGFGPAENSPGHFAFSFTDWGRERRRITLPTLDNRLPGWNRWTSRFRLVIRLPCRIVIGL